MINRRKRTIILIEDNYPDYDHEDSCFISTTLEKAGYTIHKVTIADLMSTRSNVQQLHAFLMIVPACRNLPLEVLPVLRDYSESAGSVLFIGGPLFYNLVENGADGYHVRQISNLLDATFTTDVKYIREGICPSYKTYDTKNITRVKAAEDQNIFRGELNLPEPVNVCIPCETGVEGGFEREANSRFIRIADCLCDEGITEPVKRGRQNGRRGAFAFIQLARTEGIGYSGRVNYGTIETSMIGSAAAMIGVRHPIRTIGGMETLLVSMVNRMNCGLYLMDGGVDGIRYHEGEELKIGAEILNTTDRYAQVECVVTAETSGNAIILKKSLLAPPFYTTRISKAFDFGALRDQIDFGVDYTVCAQLYLEGQKIDELKTVYSFEKPIPVHDASCYVRAEGSRFVLNGEPWYMAGINYWPTHYQAKEKTDYWKGYLDKCNYNPQNIEDDLAFIEEIGINSIMLRLDITGLDRVKHGIRDLLVRCRRHNIRMGISIAKATNSHFYCKEAVDEIFYQVFLANNPTVMLFDLEWESVGDLHGNKQCRAEFNDEWSAFLKREYGSIDNAEKILEVTFPRDIYGYAELLDIDKHNIASAKAHRKFAYENDVNAWKQLSEHLRPRIPYQMASARIAHAYTVHRFNPYYDLALPETYGLGFIHYDTDPMDYRKHIGFCVCSDQIFRNESGNKPVVWAEYGCSTCGLAWLGYEPFAYDHDNQEYLPEKINRQIVFNRMMMEAIEESGCAGSAPWCWNGGLRYTEMSDVGYMYADGVFSESGAEYVEFCRRMKAKVLQPIPIDERPVYVVEGDPDNYIGSKNEFIRKVCLPAYMEAREKGMRLEIRSPKETT